MIAVLLVFALVAPNVWAQEPIYRSTGDHGETSFSDVRAVGAVEISVAAIPVSETQAQLVQDLHASILAVAEDLAAARRAREAARAERSVRAPAVPTRVGEIEPRYYPVAALHPYHPWYHRPHGPRKPVPRLPERRPFEPVFRPIPPAFGQ